MNKEQKQHLASGVIALIVGGSVAIMGGSFLLPALITYFGLMIFMGMDD